MLRGRLWASVALLVAMLGGEGWQGAEGVGARVGGVVAAEVARAEQGRESARKLARVVMVAPEDGSIVEPSFKVDFEV